MAQYPSVEVALDALQARNRELEQLVAERTAELEAARSGVRVEAALERVRAQALSLQHSDETLGVAVAVFEALRDLGLPVLEVGLSGPADPATGEVPVWAAGVDAAGDPRASQYVASRTGHPGLDAAFGAGRGGVHRAGPMDRPAFEGYLRALLAHYPPSYAERVVARAPRAETYHLVSVPAGTPSAARLAAVLSAAPTDGEVAVLERFAALFGVASARHEDLRRADVQARASQIEAALERVRARALAMRRSDELDVVVGALLGELDALGVRAHLRGVNAAEGEGRRVTFWLSEVGGGPTVRGTARLEGHPLYDAFYEAWRQQRDLSYILEGADRRAYYRRLAETHAGRPDAPAPPAGDVREYVHAVAAPSGMLFAFADLPFAEDTVGVMQRLAGAFHVAYTRHLDLEQAEAQEREATRRAAADRVRAEIASMRSVGDLDRITPLVWEELTALGVPFTRCGVFIVEDEGAVRVFLATPAGDPLGSLRLPVGAHPLLRQLVEAWGRGETLAAAWGADEAAAWARTLAAHGLGGPPGDAPDGLALHFVPFAQGMLYVGGPAPLAPGAAGDVQALADAFEVAYARYDDFQQLDARTREVEGALAELRAAQDRLVQSEKLASLGALTAGIAHEIKNPLNFVNNFAALSGELAAELAEEVEAGAPPDVLRELLGDIQANAEKIEAHGRRADSIVRAMMQHARGGEGRREPVDVNALVEEHLALAYHGRRAQDRAFEATVLRDYADDVGRVEAVPQDVGRVLLNLIGNAFDAVATRAAAPGPDYEPTVRVATARAGGGVEVRVEDNGVGIAEDVRPRVFEPFFTTKPAGAGTGLGLSMSHDIVEQGHGGTLRVESEPGRGATFVVWLPG